jgi:hypothetical protein
VKDNIDSSQRFLRFQGGFQRFLRVPVPGFRFQGFDCSCANQNRKDRSATGTLELLEP